MSDAGFPIPPPTFEFLVFSLKTQAEMRLGLLNFGEEKDAAPDLPSARHAIDLLAMIAEKTKGNLSIEEQRLIENALTEPVGFPSYKLVSLTANSKRRFMSKSK